MILNKENKRVAAGCIEQLNASTNHIFQVVATLMNTGAIDDVDLDTLIEATEEIQTVVTSIELDDDE